MFSKGPFKEGASRATPGRGEVGPVTRDESLEGARVEEGVAGLGSEGEG